MTFLIECQRVFEELHVITLGATFIKTLVCAARFFTQNSGVNHGFCHV
ncbi:Uncharacterised protein [Vibrio cholerae]|nr:Uncharacterised protein [Vibrio cholerae]